MTRRRRPLRAVSVVFAGFVTLVLLSQLSAHFFAEAIPKHLLAKNEAVLAGIQHTSTELALASGALGLVFAGAVLVITRKTVAADVDIYRATGLPLSSGVPPFAQVSFARPVGMGGRGGRGDRPRRPDFGLDTIIPLGLAVSFAILLVAWLAFLTSASFSHRGFDGGAGPRSG